MAITRFSGTGSADTGTDRPRYANAIAFHACFGKPAFDRMQHSAWLRWVFHKAKSGQIDDFSFLPEK
jgi:hypothetical protein